MVMLDFIYMDSADLFERGGSEKFKMKNMIPAGIQTHTTPVHDRKVSSLNRYATLVKYQVEHIYSLTVF